MTENTVLEWEMHGPCTEVRFQAARADAGFQLTIKKDGTVALTGVAPDGKVLLQRSQALRAELYRMGYTPKPVADTVSRHGDAPVWSFAQPLQPSLVSLLGR